MEEEMFSVLEQLYRETEESTIDCLGCNCNSACEMGDLSESVIFLPQEIEFIEEKTGRDLSDIKRIKIDGFGSFGLMDYDSLCPFLNGNHCTIRKYRMFDCRSYPIVPTWKDGILDFTLAKGCPINPNLPPRFTETIIKAWRKLDPLLPLPWKRFWDIETHRDVISFSPGNSRTGPALWEY